MKGGIFVNMQVLSFFRGVLISLRYQNGYCECGGSQLYHYGRCAMLELNFVAPKFRLRRVQKREKKSKKWKIAFCQKNFFIFACSQVEHSSGGHQKIFLTFRHQIRCAILEISSYRDKYEFGAWQSGHFFFVWKIHC